MPYLIQWCGLVAFVLIFGLPSCRRDKKVDVYHPDGIVFRHGHDPLNASAIHPQNLDIQDVLDLSGAKPSRVEVDMQCVSKGRSLRRETSWNTSNIPLLNLLPLELSPYGPKQLEPLSCSLGITLINALGSRFHHSKLKDKTFIDNQAHGVFVEETPPSLAKSGYVKWDDALVLFWSKTAGRTLRLACDDFTLSGHETDYRFTPAHFRGPAVEAEIAPALQRHPRQSCRVLEVQNEEIQSVSEMFDLFDANAWPTLQPEVAILEQPVPLAFEAVARNEARPLYDLFLTNTYTLPRRIRIGRRPTQLHLVAYGTIPRTRPRQMRGFNIDSPFDDRPWVYEGYADWAQISARIESGIAPLPPILQDEHYAYFDIAPGQRIRLRVLVVRHSAGDLSTECRAGDSPIQLAAMVFYPTQPLNIDLLLGSGEYQQYRFRYEPAYLLRGESQFDLGQVQALLRSVLPTKIDYCPN